jgi:integration host factor subunit alpha
LALERERLAHAYASGSPPPLAPILAKLPGNGSMTKKDIARALYVRLGGLSMQEADEFVDLIFETMKETLGRGEKIKISSFGNFVPRDKRQRQGRNPQTGESLVLAERRVLLFKASPVLKLALNARLDDKDVAAEE